MYPHAMKVQQNGDKCHAAIPSPEKREHLKILSNFFHVHCCSTNYVALSVIVITSHSPSTHT